jgi:TonB family protein
MNEAVNTEQPKEPVKQDSVYVPSAPTDSFRSEEDFMDVVNANMPDLRLMYTQQLKIKPGFSGKVKVKFIIAPSGEVTNIGILSSTTGDENFDNAIMDKILTWKWEPVIGGNTTITLPFNFTE